MGIGVIFDGLGMALGKGIKKVRKGKGGKEIIEDGTQDAVERAFAREQNVEAQISEKAILQAQTMRGQYGAYKNNLYLILGKQLLTLLETQLISFTKSKE